MGFIDYHGTKEDRYDEVLEYARLQQAEERKRLQDAKIDKWLIEILGESKYIGLTINETIKYVIVRYRKLCELKDSLLNGYSEDIPIDTSIFWKDFASYIISRHLEPFGFDDEKKKNYYTVFASKVFKIPEFTSAEKHYSALQDKEKYAKYFSDCFDVTGEKQFWRWLGKVGAKEHNRLLEFVSVYEQLTVLMGYYLFQGVRPNDDGWMRCLEIEKQVLEKIREEYAKNRLKEPNCKKMHNPLFESEKQYEASPTTARGESDFVLPELEKPLRPQSPQLDRECFKELIDRQELMSYVEACRLLRKCELPENVDDIYKELILRITVLQESIDKYKDIYKPDIYVFCDYYIPEALNLTAVYLEYLDVGISDRILQENEDEVIASTKKLLIAINDKVDEIYKFASIEMKASAKALEAVMSQDGYIDDKYKIRKDGGTPNE